MIITILKFQKHAFIDVYYFHCDQFCDLRECMFVLSHVMVWHGAVCVKDEIFGCDVNHLYIVSYDNT